MLYKIFHKCSLFLLNLTEKYSKSPKNAQKMGNGKYFLDFRRYPWIFHNVLGKIGLNVGLEHLKCLQFDTA